MVLGSPSHMTGRVVYEDYHLRYLPGRANKWLPNVSADIVQVGDLTIMVDGLTRTFCGFNFYTDRSRWGLSRTHPPESAVERTLQFESPQDPRHLLSYDGTPWVERSFDGKWLRLVLAPEPAASYVSCAKGVLGGLVDDKFLVDFWLRYDPEYPSPTT